MSTRSTQVQREALTRDPASGASARETSADLLATEQPLEIRVEGRSVAVVMRTPGHDEELAAGFLLTEGVVRNKIDIFEISQCPSIDSDAGLEETNVVEILLAKGTEFDLDALTRHVFSSSSCGICGKATIESVFQSFPHNAPGDLSIPAATILALPDKLRAAQQTFDETGGLHASALFNAAGEIQLIREDVGRHNALDKVIGHALLNDLLPLSSSILLVSGRTSFELAQKALAAGIPLLAGISAPSSLAVEFANRSNQTLIGFLRPNRFNLYSHSHRISNR